MPPFIDLTGQTFGRLSVIERDTTTVCKSKVPRWWCKCECGKVTSVYSNALRTGLTTSCGCLRLENVTSHGKTKTREFTIWQMMQQRCYNPKQNSYKRYGARGITVCQEWRDDFMAFLADMGEAPSPTHTLDRIDNNGPYCKENCKWATSMEQGANKANNVLIEYDGETLHISEWSRRVGLDISTIKRRIERGWSVKDALTKPALINGKKPTRESVPR